MKKIGKVFKYGEQYLCIVPKQDCGVVVMCYNTSYDIADAAVFPQNTLMPNSMKGMYTEVPVVCTVEEEGGERRLATLDRRVKEPENMYYHPPYARRNGHDRRKEGPPKDRRVTEDRRGPWVANQVGRRHLHDDRRQHYQTHDRRTSEGRRMLNSDRRKT